jgi:hypothetical protein
MKLQLPYKFWPRVYQMPLFAALENGEKKRACLVWHRRAGKDKTALNFTVTQMMKRVGSYYYFFPTFAQGRKIIWDGIDKDGMKYTDHFPAEMVVASNASEMKVIVKHPVDKGRTGSLFQIVGTDNFDAVVGTNPVGCVFSEYALQNPEAWDYFRPILTENGGWAIFLYTPRGQNHGLALLEMAKANPNWFWQILTVDDTRREDGTPVISEADIEEDRASGMSEDLVQQEYYCSFARVGGQAFRFERLHHVIDPIPIPEGAPIYMTFDWGYGAPFSLGWWWVDIEGRLYRFDEWYGATISRTGKIEGLRLTDDEIAMGINRKETEIAKLIIQQRLAGPDCFSKKPDYRGGGQGPSTAEVFSRYQLYLNPGDADRKLKIRQFRARLRIFKDPVTGQEIQDIHAPNYKRPMLVVYKGCTDFIRTIPLIPVSKHNVEDIDTTSEDHPFDEACHICMARPMKLEPKDTYKSVHDRRIEELERPKLDDYEEWARRDQVMTMGRLGGVDFGPEQEVEDGDIRRDLIDTVHR